MVFVPELAGNTPNIWVDSVWFDEPVRIEGRQAALHVRMQHNSRASVDRIPMNLRINGERVAIGTFNLVPGIPTDTVLRFTHGAAGIQSASVEVEDAPIRFDDRWHFGYDVLNQIDILVLSSGNSETVNTALRRAYNTAGGLYRVTYQTQWNPGDFAGQQVVVLNDWPASGPASTTRCSPMLRMAEPPFTSLRRAPPTHRCSRHLAWPRLLRIDQPDRVRDLQMDHPFFTDMFAQTPERIDLPAVESIWNRQPGDRMRRFWPPRNRAAPSSRAFPKGAARHLY